MTGWLAAHRGDSRFARFTGHFEVLEVVLARMLERIVGEVRAMSDQVGAALGRQSGAAVPMTAGAVYDRCRALDRALVTVRRMFE